MWAFLSRPRASLLRQLHAASRRVNEPPSVLGGGSRRHVSDASNGDRRDESALVQHGRAQCDGGHHRTSSSSLQHQQKQFLYLVLDDMKKGCSVHKVDVAAAADDDNKVVGRLPGPPAFRMQYPNLGEYYTEPYVAVLGSNIIAIDTGTDDRCGEDAFTVTFDLKTAALTFLHGEPTDLHDRYFNLAVATGNMLFLFPGPAEGRAMECLELLQEADDESSLLYSKPRWRWSYHAVPDTDAICADQAMYPRTVTDGIFAYALHPRPRPRGRAFFVSSRLFSYVDRAFSYHTFSYDTERREWTHHGDWHLPFHGQAHYDRDLGVWVGLHYHCQRDCSLDTDGYLCCCDVPPPALGPPPTWKRSKEKLFAVDLERHIDAKLVPMGGSGGRFCLVEILTRDGVDRKGCLGDGDKCLLRITTFRVKHGDDGGELTITARRPVGEYTLSRYVHMFEAQAFWM